MDFSAQELVDQVDLYAAFTGIIKPSVWDMFFLVVGRTGSGKSTFISQCTGKDVNIGHTLQSCTQSIEVFDFCWMERRIFLIDTPGFNDSNRSDAEILEAFASCLSASYVNQVRIHGIIMLHPISDTRMSGSSLRNIEMMKAMCGFARYDNLAIVTTMWPQLPKQDAQSEQLESRYSQLLTDERFFGGFLRRGAEVFRYGEESSAAQMAQHIVAHLVRRADMHPIEALQLQLEIVHQNKPLKQTAAGLVVGSNIFQRMAENKKLAAELSATNASHLERLFSFRSEVVEQMERGRSERQILDKTLRDMHKDGKERWERKLDEILHQELEKVHEQLRDIQSSKHRLITPVEDLDEQDLTVASLKEKISHIHRAQDKFERYKGQLMNGAMNGLAAGLTGGIIAVTATGLACTIM